MSTIAPDSITVSDRERSLRVFPAGSNGEFDLPADLTMVVRSGSGCRLRDTEGRDWLDMSMGWGSAMPGHAHPAIVEAVQRQLASGTNFAYTNEASLALAEQIVALSPACDRVRFCTSGSEAILYCLRLARAFTGRSGVLKFEGAYHGASDIGVLSLMPREQRPFPQPEPSCDGTTDRDVLVAPYNDLATTRRIVEQAADTLGAIIVEPFQRCLPPVPGFLSGLRTLCNEFRIPLIFDEVVTGFRFAYGGAQTYYGVTPDLVAYGKALGGGLPIGAYGGRADIMTLVEESRLGTGKPYVWTASTLGCNAVSCAAACAALHLYRTPGAYECLHALGRRLRDGLTTAVKEAGVPAQVLGDGPLGMVAFSSSPVIDYRSTAAADRKLGRRVMLGLFSRGVFLNPMGTKLYLSLAHDFSAVDTLVHHFRASLREALAVRE
jgi:glutamate-1-semialdehyde 2,1-aminomutase